MAMAEARALWQRTANRLFVQEDAKRAPKLACCQSSSSASKSADSSPTSASDRQDHHPIAPMPIHRHPCSNISPDTRWWFEMQRSSRYQHGLTSELLNTSETDVETIRAGGINSSSKGCGAELEKESDSFSHIYDLLSDCIKKDSDIGRPGLKALHHENSEDYKLEDTRKYSDAIKDGPESHTVAKQSDEVFFLTETSWVLCEKAGPWWRTADGDELASLVAQKSLDLVENCDLPPPQKRHVRRRLPEPRAAHGKGVYASLDEDVTQYNSEKSFSYSSATPKNVDDDRIPESDPVKAQILEALHHSQSRAREAETAAKQAYAETERLLKIFFRQASQLFAYKQWLQLLQLESLYLQKKNGDQPTPGHSQVILPLTPYSKSKTQETTAKGKCRKRSRPSFDITKYALAIALGLSLSAGLILGWTVAWMLPSF